MKKKALLQTYVYFIYFYLVQKYIYILFLLLVLACSQKTKQVSDFYFAGDERVSYHGRFSFDNAKSPKVWAPGAYCEFSFKGTSCEVTILDQLKYFVTHNYIAVSIDGGKPKRIKLKKVNNILKIAQNLEDKIHTVVICKNTEAAIGYIQFTGIRCEELVKVKRKKKKIIEYIGDSITCGNGSDTTEISCADGKWYDQHNAYLSYGPIIARKHKYDWILSSISGIGLTESCCGTKYTMPEVYDKIDFKPKGENWYDKKQTPSIICITLGQNDGRQEKNLYINTYVTFVKKLHQRFPMAEIVCCSSPMGDDKLKVYQAEHLPTIVAKLKQSGITRVNYFCYKGKYRGGCLLHPTLSEHRTISYELDNFLEENGYF
ncbi:MAG: acetyl xylan esterase [Flavobacteriia bacterium]